MMRRRFAALCSILLTLALLTSCAGNAVGGNALGPPPAPTPTPSASTPAPSAPAETAPVETEAPALLNTFTTTDLEGNEVTQDALSGYKLTMVNVWATYCSPCLGEMPDLGKIHGDYADRDFQVMGLVTDVLNQDGTLSDDQLELARDIVEQTGADYLHMVPSEDLYGILSQVTAVPLTFFVDEAGNQVGYAYAGARSESEWLDILEPLLEEVGA